MIPKEAKLMWSTKGAALGAFIGVAIGVIAGFVPVFHWEMAGLFLIPFTSFGGLVAGAFGASRRLVLGGLAGSLSFGALWAIFALTASLPPNHPWGIPISGGVAVVLASFAGAVIAGLILGTEANPTFRVQGTATKRK